MTSEHRAVRVVARLRPPLNDEEELCTFAQSEDNYIDIINFRNQEEHLRYNFSQVFDQVAGQNELFTGTVEPLLNDLFSGYNASVLAYGPTGAGKTYSTLGTSSEPGIIPRSVEGLLHKMEENQTTCTSQLTFSYLEIYNEKLVDLLVKEASSDLQIREDPQRRIHVAGLSEKPITSLDDFNEHFLPASKRRTVASTKLNQHSSRSHSILLLKLTIRPKNTNKKLVSKLYIIDLAGSENNKKTGNRGIRLKESGAINNSLFVLGQVVDALNHNLSRIPYRDSKLTRLLQDSFGGSAQAVVITNLAPELSHYMLTYTTLNFAQKTRQVVNRPTANPYIPATPIRPLRPLCNQASVQVAEPDSSQSVQSAIPVTVSFTPLRQSLLSPIKHTQQEICSLSERMQKLESLLEHQINGQESMMCAEQENKTVVVEDKSEREDELGTVAPPNEVKENRSPSPGPLPVKRLRRQFDWGSPLPVQQRTTMRTRSSMGSPQLDSSVLFVQKENPIRKRVKSTAVRPRTVTSTDSASSSGGDDNSITDPCVKKQHADEILRVLNHGDLKSVCKLTMMGPKRGQSVIDYRTLVGKFQQISDIDKVPAFTKSFVVKFLKANYVT